MYFTFNFTYIIVSIVISTIFSIVTMLINTSDIRRLLLQNNKLLEETQVVLNEFVAIVADYKNKNKTK